MAKKNIAQANGNGTAMAAESRVQKQDRSQISPNLDMLARVLGSTQDQVRFADSKAAFVAAFHALLFGFIVSSSNRLAALQPQERGPAFWVASVLLALYGVATVAAVVLIICSVMSRFGELAPQCKVFFGHIVKQYGKDYGKYCREAKAMTDDQWAEELGSQIVEVGHIAAAKHKLVRRAAVCTLIAFTLWIATFIAMIPLPHH